MISFIIPAHNEEELLPRTLASIHGAARVLAEPYEIVVADDASTDDTGRLAREGGARVVRVEHRKISATRNSGARAAEGDVLFFVDADTTLSDAVIRAALRELRDGAVGGTANMRLDGEVPLYGRVLTKAVVGAFRVLRLGGGAFLFCWRAAFDSVGGFDESLFASEEIAFCRALGRLGRFAVLDETVVTSGRKLRDHTTREMFTTMFKLALGGRRALTNRDELGLWYDQRKGSEKGTPEDA